MRVRSQIERNALSKEEMSHHKSDAALPIAAINATKLDMSIPPR